MFTLPCKTYRTSFFRRTLHTFPYKLWTFSIKFSLTVETIVFNSQQQFPSCLLIRRIMHERDYDKRKIVNVEELRQRIVDKWRRREGVAKTTTSVCCSWRRTFWTWTVTPGATVLLQLYIMTLPFNRLTAYNIAMTVFSVLWLFQSHAAVMKCQNAFCVKLTANSDTEQNKISKSTFPICVSEHFHI